MDEHSAPLLPDPTSRPTLTIEEAGEVLGIGRSLAYEASRTGELPTFRIGGRILVPTAKLLDRYGLAVTPTQGQK